MPKLIISSLFTVHRKTVNRKSKGFTLIELLVVISIIGILSALGTVSFTAAQQRARDSRRKADVQAIKKALELARQDSTGGAFYPQNGVIPFGQKWSNGASTYMQQVPTDPQTAAAYGYNAWNIDGSACGTWPTGGCNFYHLWGTMENTNDSDITATHTRCANTDTLKTYIVCPD